LFRSHFDPNIIEDTQRAKADIANLLRKTPDGRNYLEMPIKEFFSLFQSAANERTKLEYPHLA
jgi:hypothetical protein